MKKKEGIIAMKKLLSVILVTVLCAAFLTGCDEGGSTAPSVTPSTASPEAAAPVPAAPEPAAPEPINLTVFAAASLTEALNEISELYKVKAPEVTLVFNFDSSGKLQTQIENGAEADLFFSAAQKQMDALEENYIDKTTRRDLLINKVVLIVPQDSTKDITSFEDCMTDKVSLMSLGNADVPVGQYSEEIFRHLDGWDIVQGKASLGSNVKEVLSQVESGSVDCGVIYSTDAATASGVKIAANAPEGSHKPVVYPAAVLKDSANPEAAKAFLDYLSTAEAVEVFEKIGFEILK